MRKVMRLLLIGLLFLIPTFIFANNDAALLAKMLSQYTTYQAQFKQVTYNDYGKIVHIARGKIFLMRPGQFRWEMKQPDQQIIVAKNNTLWIYDVDLMQVTKQTLTPENNNEPAALLSGDIHNITQQFTVTIFKKTPKEVLFQLIPKRSQGLREIRLDFNHNRLKSLLLVNNLNHTSVFEFSKIQLNAKLNPQLFIFIPPAGVEVLQPSDKR